MSQTETAGAVEVGQAGDRLAFRRKFNTAPLSYVAPLDGVRGYALIAVLLYHSRFTWIPGAFLAVSLFFTLSGFLITSLLLREWAGDGAINMRSFWSRRFRRLLPAAWVTLAGIMVLGALGVWDGDQLGSIRGDIPFSLLQVVNWHFILEQRTYAAGFVAPTPVEHFWSLSVEEQFYVFLPLTVLAIFTFGARRSFMGKVRTIAVVLGSLTVASAVLNGVLARNSVDRSYFGSDTRMAEMLAGALLACAMVRHLRQPEEGRRRVLAALGVVGLVASVALWLLASLRAQWMYPWGFLACSAATCAIIAGSLQEGLAARILSFKPMVMLGRISYGTYLVHWPIFLALSPARLNWAPWPLFALRFTISVATAVLMFRFVEEPVRRRRLLSSRQFLVGGATLLPILIVGTLFVTRNAEPTSVIQRAGKDAGAVAVPTSDTRVLFLGDQASSVVAKMVDGGASDRIRASAEVVDDCGLAVGGWVMTPSGGFERDVSRCGGAMDTWTDAIAAGHPDLVVVVPSERDAAIRKVDDTTPWAAPGPPTGSDFLSVEIGSSLDSISEAASAVHAAVVLMSTPAVERDEPTALPPRAQFEDSLAELMATEEEKVIAGTVPDPADLPDVSERLQALNVTAAAVAKSRGIEFADLSGELGQLVGGAAAIDARSDAPAPPEDVARGVAKWFASVAKNQVTGPAPAPETPQNLRDIQIPAAPPLTPRLRVPPGQKPSIVVAGDSIAYGLGFGLQEWADQGDRATIDIIAHFGCPVARGGRYRFKRDSDSFDPSCDWGDLFPGTVHAYRPEVVMLSSSVWEVVDRQLQGDARYRHIGDELMDKYILAEYLSAVDSLASGGATVAVLTAPHIQAGFEHGYRGLPESDPVRIDRLNEIIRQMVRLRPGVTKLIDLQGWLASQGNREMNPDRRPDGIHFTDAETRSIADWLGPQLVETAKGV